MRTSIKILASVILLTGVALGAGAFQGEPQSLVAKRAFPTEDLPKNAADCRFFSGHERLYLANPSRTWTDVSVRTAQVASKLPTFHATAAPETKNFIDKYIFDKIAQKGAPTAALTSDEEFIRRVYLDLTGRIPSADDVRAFIADKNTNKRDLLVDALVGSEAYVYRWTNFFGDLLNLVVASQTTGTVLYVDGRTAWYEFIRDAIQANTPYNQTVSKLITAAGDSFEVGPTNFLVHDWQRNGPIQDSWDNLAVSVGRAFLGLSLECLSCHGGAGHTDSINLYLSSKTRSDFWKMAAFFARLSDNRGRNPFQVVRVSDQPQVAKYIVADAASGEYLLNTTGGNKTPRQPLQGQPNFVTPAYIFNGQKPGISDRYRDALARMVTGDHQFAKATVNYLWQEMFGIGMVEPADGFDLLRQDPTNPPPDEWTLQPTHPELLEALATEFEKSGYNLQHILKLIAKSSTYQLSSRFDGEWKEEWTPLFARKFARRLKAEEAHDAITKATGIIPNYTVQRSYDANAKPAWTMQWAMQLPDPTEPRSDGRARNFLNTFLRGNRDGQPRKSEGSILQALSLLNDTFVTNRVRARDNSTVQKLLSQSLDNNRLVEELYLATLSRYPTATEKTAAVNYLTQGNRTQQLEDLQFALINKIDFLYNY
jgi:hypothetical protein